MKKVSDTEIKIFNGDEEALFQGDGIALTQDGLIAYCPVCKQYLQRLYEPINAFADLVYFADCKKCGGNDG